MKVSPLEREEVPSAVMRWVTGAEGRERRMSAAKRVETQPVPGRG
jgi:hypothetical protein